MPSVAVPSVKPGVTFRPPATALSSVTVKEIASPSLAEASAIVTAALPSSLVMVPVAVSVAVTVTVVPETLRPTVNVSSVSTTASSVVDTVKLRVSPAVPANVSADVFSV